MRGREYETYEQARRREEWERRQDEAAARGRAERRDRLRAAGIIGNSERRSRAIMTVPPKLKLNTKEGVSMMLLSATTVSTAELTAGARAGGVTEEQLIRALGAMGFLCDGERRSSGGRGPQ